MPKQPPSFDAMLAFLRRVLPGESSRIDEFRLAIVDFATTLTGRSVLLTGPIGSGKSTVARTIALLKRVAPLTREEAGRILADAQFDGPNRIRLSFVPWYVELTLTGLVETLAESQLFGTSKGSFTGATERAGVFEAAMLGRADRPGREPVGARLTGGVVFLDEVGDLAPELQAKLLPVLSGGAFYRVGAEGRGKALQFNGVTISASWKKLDEVLRPDLLSRLSAYVIDVPGINDRIEDFGLLYEQLETGLIASMKAAIDNAAAVDIGVDREFWLARRDAIGPLDADVRRKLAVVDWSRHGNLRGLTSAIEQLLAHGGSVTDVIARLPRVVTGAALSATDAISETLLSQLLRRQPEETGLAGQLRVLELERRLALRAQLMADPAARKRLAEQFATTEEKLLPQIHQLARSRRQPAMGA